MKWKNALELRFEEFDNKIRSAKELSYYVDKVIEGIINGNYSKEKILLFKLWLKERLDIDLELVIKNRLVKGW